MALTRFSVPLIPNTRHGRLHRLAALCRWLPEPLVALWAEQHPGVPVQLQFPEAV